MLILKRLICLFIYHKWHHKVDGFSNSANVGLLQMSRNTDLGWFWLGDNLLCFNLDIFYTVYLQKNWLFTIKKYIDLTNNLFNQNIVLKGPRRAGSGCIDGFDSNCDFTPWTEVSDGVLCFLCQLWVGHNPVISCGQQTDGFVLYLRPSCWVCLGDVCLLPSMQYSTK